MNSFAYPGELNIIAKAGAVARSAAPPLSAYAAISTSVPFPTPPVAP